MAYRSTPIVVTSGTPGRTPTRAAGRPRFVKSRPGARCTAGCRRAFYSTTRCIVVSVRLSSAASAFTTVYRLSPSTRRGGRNEESEQVPPDIPRRSYVSRVARVHRRGYRQSRARPPGGRTLAESDADSTRTTARRAPVRRAARPGERCTRQVCARITRAARCRFRYKREVNGTGGFYSTVQSVPRRVRRGEPTKSPRRSLSVSRRIGRDRAGTPTCCSFRIRIRYSKPIAASTVVAGPAPPPGRPAQRRGGRQAACAASRCVESRRAGPVTTPGPTAAVDAAAAAHATRGAAHATPAPRPRRATTARARETASYI